MTSSASSGEQAVARGRDHHRIHDQRSPAILADGARPRGGRAPASASMPVLSAAGGRSSASAVSCAVDHRVGHGLDRAHPERVLRGEGDDDRGAEDAELLEGLEVGLDAGATAGVGAGNRERDLHRVSISMSSSLQTLIRDLHRRRGRERRGLALAEGVRLVEEALATAITVRGAAVSPALEATTRGEALKAALLATGRRGSRQVSDQELDELADTEHPQGIVAVIEPKAVDAGGHPPVARGRRPGAGRGAGSRQRRHHAPHRAGPGSRGPDRAPGHRRAHQSEGPPGRDGRELPPAGRPRDSRRAGGMGPARSGRRSGLPTWTAETRPVARAHSRSDRPFCWSSATRGRRGSRSWLRQPTGGSASAWLRGLNRSMWRLPPAFFCMR